MIFLGPRKILHGIPRVKPQVFSRRPKTQYDLENGCPDRQFFLNPLWIYVFSTHNRCRPAVDLNTAGRCRGLGWCARCAPGASGHLRIGAPATATTPQKRVASKTHRGHFRIGPRIHQLRVVVRKTFGAYLGERMVMVYHRKQGSDEHGPQHPHNVFVRLLGSGERREEVLDGMCNSFHASSLWYSAQLVRVRSSTVNSGSTTSGAGRGGTPRLASNSCRSALLRLSLKEV